MVEAKLQGEVPKCRRPSPLLMKTSQCLYALLSNWDSRSWGKRVGLLKPRAFGGGGAPGGEICCRSSANQGPHRLPSHLFLLLLPTSS